MQHIITCLADSHTSLATLTAQQSDKINSHITAQIDRLAQLRVDDRRYDEIIGSLFYPDIFARQEQIDHVFDGIKDSYEWIFEEPQDETVNTPDQDQGGATVCCCDNFAKWLNSGHGLYYIRGKPGAGKSTLMNYICQHRRRLELLQEWCGHRLLLTPAYFFWNAGSRQQKSVDGLLRSLIYQMLLGCRELIGCFQVSYPLPLSAI